MSKQTNCQQSELSGLAPTPETVQDWMDKLTANGITEGVLCRLIHGRDEGKIVKFDNYGINDLGVYTEGGYFLYSDIVIRVAEPLFVPLLELTDDVKFFGRLNMREKTMFLRNCDFLPLMFIKVNENGIVYDTTIWFSESDFHSYFTKFYQFRTAKDLFAWMGLNEGL